MPDGVLVPDFVIAFTRLIERAPPEAEALGLGRRLLEWLTESAYAAGITAIHLELRAANQGARRFYRSMGFNETAYIPGYYRGREMALRMLKEIVDRGEEEDESPEAASS